jgi:WD40 repeat protein
MVVSVSWDQSVRMWKAATGHSVSTKSTHSSSVMGTSFSLDGSMVASASVDETVRLWDSRTGEAVGGLCVSTVRFGLRMAPGWHHALDIEPLLYGTFVETNLSL